MKEKNIPLTIRIPQSRVDDIKRMATFFKVSPSKMASLMLESGFQIADAFKTGEMDDIIKNALIEAKINGDIQ